jgi:hypothetical protein
MPLGVVGPGQHLQRIRRVSRTFTDHHGRHFYAEADAASNQPIGELQPIDSCPPWRPPMRFAKFKRDGDLNFTWDYQSMADELAAEVASYYEAVTKFALEHNLPEPEIGGVVDRRLQAIYGRPPMSPEIPIAASMGHPWLLGVAGSEKDPELAAVLQQGTSSTGNDALRAIRARVEQRLAGKVPRPVTLSHVSETPSVPASDGPVTYHTFMAEGRKMGMSMPDIAMAWKEHKSHIADEQAA